MGGERNDMTRWQKIRWATLIFVLLVFMLLLGRKMWLDADADSQREEALRQRNLAAIQAAAEDQTPYWCSLSPKPGLSGYIVQTIGLPRLVEGPLVAIPQERPRNKYDNVTVSYERDSHIIIRTPQGDIVASDNTSFFCATNREALNGR